MGNNYQISMWRPSSILIGYFTTLALFLAASIYLSQYSLNYFTLGLGFVVFVYIPGYLILKLFDQPVKFNYIGYPLTLGIIFQLVNLGLYHIVTLNGPLNFLTYLSASTTITVVFIRYLLKRSKTMLNLSTIREDISNSGISIITFIFFFALITHSLYADNNIDSMRTDASLYFDIARNTVTDGSVSSLVTNDETYLANPFIANNGLIEHRYFGYGLTIFFQIFEPSLVSGKLMIVFISSLLVYPTFSLTSKLFNRRTGYIASILVTIHPLFLYFSSINYGPEIFGVFFAVFFIDIFIKALEKKSITLFIVSGISLGLIHDIWYAYFYIIIPVLPILFLIFYSNEDSERVFRIKKYKPMGLLIFFAIVFLYVFALKVSSLMFIWIPVTIFELLFLILIYSNISRLLRSKLIPHSLFFVLGMIVTSGMLVIRNYLTPLNVSAVMNNALNNGIGKSITGAFTSPFHNNSILDSIINNLRYLEFHSTLLILILFIVSLITPGRWKSKLVLGSLFLSQLILFSLAIDNTYPSYLYPSGRYYLLATILILISVAYLISSLISIVDRRKGSVWMKMKEFYLNFKNANKIYMILAIIPLAITAIYFFPLYYDGIQDIQSESILSKYLWPSNMIAWFETNTNQSESILADRARELSWYTNRPTIYIMQPPLPTSEIGDPELENIIKKFNPKYILTDKYFSDSFPKLRYLADPSVATYPIETTLLSKYSLIKVLNSTKQFNNDFGSVFIDPNTNGDSEVNDKLLGYELMNYTRFDQRDDIQNNIWKIDMVGNNVVPLFNEDSFDDWSIGNDGKLIQKDSEDILSIKEGRNYAYLSLHKPLGIKLSTEEPHFIALKINENDTTSNKIIIELVDDQGTIIQSIVNPPQISDTLIEYIKPTSAVLKSLNIVISGNSSETISISSLQIGKIAQS